ncbi:hypothetical protein PIB30_014155 [Stylosanthes scabra]|uniref:Transposase MuDR plant domain-containing protein n=1 Tax=Stylosanthes scabra TaxID=79078 RepID=A0ABU6U6J0_9FABA|nr:hypothetical protein [Stylosanthes scabra]
MDDVHAIIYSNGEISQSSEGVMFSCEDPAWIMIHAQACLQDLKNLILISLAKVGRKEVTRILYRMSDAVANSFVYRKMPLRTDQNVAMMFSYHRGIASVFAIELCVQMQDVGGSSSSSNHVESGRGISINDGDRMPANRMGDNPSPSFSPHVNRPAQQAPPEVPHFGHHAGGFTIHSPEPDDAQAGADNSESGGDDDEEFIPETQQAIAGGVLRLPSIVRPLRGVVEEAAHYSTIDAEAMHSASVEDDPSSYPISGELELEIGLKFNNREIAMLAVKNYNIRRSAEFKVVESDRAMYVSKCKQFGGQCQWMIRVPKTKSSSRFWEVRKYQGLLVKNINVQRWSRRGLFASELPEDTINRKNLYEPKKNKRHNRRVEIPMGCASELRRDDVMNGCISRKALGPIDIRSPVVDPRHEQGVASMHALCLPNDGMAHRSVEPAQNCTAPTIFTNTIKIGQQWKKPRMDRVVCFVWEKYSSEHVQDIASRILLQHVLRCVQWHLLQPGPKPDQLYIVFGGPDVTTWDISQQLRTPLPNVFLIPLPPRSQCAADGNSVYRDPKMVRNVFKGDRALPPRKM